MAGLHPSFFSRSGSLLRGVSRLFPRWCGHRLLRDYQAWIGVVLWSARGLASRSGIRLWTPTERLAGLFCFAFTRYPNPRLSFLRLLVCAPSVRAASLDTRSIACYCQRLSFNHALTFLGPFFCGLILFPSLTRLVCFPIRVFLFISGVTWLSSRWHLLLTIPFAPAALLAFPSPYLPMALLFVLLVAPTVCFSYLYRQARSVGRA